MINRFLTLTAFGVIAAVGIASSAVAADYPTKDIRMVIPWGAGGGTDGIVRKISKIAETELGQTVYVENIEGGVSATGVMEVMKARPDGYTIGALTYDSVVTVPWQGLLPGYELDKLALVGRITSEADAIIVSKDAPYQSLAELVDAAKQAPGKLKVGIQNTGSRLHLAMLQLQDQTGAQFKLIAYPGGAAPQKEAMLSGEVDVVATSLGDFASLLESGDARGLVEFSDTRNPTYPDVPTAKEEGVDLQMGSFIILAAPAGTPDDVIGTLEAAYRNALESDEFQQWVAKVGVTPNWAGADAVTDWALQTQSALFAQMQALVDQGVLTK